MGALADIKKGMASATGNKIEEPVVKKTTTVEKAVDKDSDVVPSLFSALGTLYINMVLQFSKLDMDILNANDVLARDGLRPEERYVSLEAADYLAKNFGYILAALCVDYNDFRSFVVDSINLELDIDRMSDDRRADMRAKMNATPTFKASKEFGMYIGVTNFSNYVSAGFEEVADKGFNTIKGTKLESDVDAAVKKFTESDRTVLGFIFSEYIYFIRAFNHNAKFSSEFISRINAYRKSYNL